MRTKYNQPTEREQLAFSAGSLSLIARLIHARNIEADPRISLVQQSNAGVSAARNHGLALAQGRFVMFLDGDDVLNPTAFARLAASLDARDSAVAAFGTFLKILPGGAPYPDQKPLAQHRYPDGDVLEPMLRGNFLANGGHVLIRTDVARKLGGFDTRLRLSEDWEFWCRLAAEGEFAFIGTEPEIFSLRVRPGSSSGGLSVDWANHQPCLDTIGNNAAIRARFSAPAWHKLERTMRASQMWECGRVNLNVEVMEREALSFLGTHDFNDFSIPRHDGKSTECTLTEFRLEQRGHVLVWHIKGNRFLHRQVRSMMGMLFLQRRSLCSSKMVPTIVDCAM